MDQGDTNLVIDLNKKAWNAAFSDLELSKKYASEALQIANKLKYSKGASYSFNIYGNYHKTKGKYDSALFYYQKSLGIRKKIGDPLDIARSYRNIVTVEGLRGNNTRVIETGLQAIQFLKPYEVKPDILIEKAWLELTLAPFYADAGDFSQATNFLFDAQRTFAKHGDEKGLAAVCMNLGNLYESQSLYSKAMREYTAAIPILVQTDNQQELAKAYNNIGNIYFELKDYKNALTNCIRALNIRQEHGFTDEIKDVLLNLGIIYDVLEKNDSAYYYYEISHDLISASQNLKSKYESYRALGIALYDKGQYKPALKYLLLGEHSNPVLSERVIILSTLSKVYEALGKTDSALLYSNQYTRLSDSLNEVLRRSIELGVAYKDKEHELQISEEKAKSQAVILITIILFLLIIFFLYYLIMRSKRRMQELKEVVKDKELKALDAMLEGQHEERKRLATELHDTIGSALAATKYLFKGMEKTIEKMLEENKGQYRKINTMLDETMESVRRISHNMASGIFTEKGMEGALTDLSQTFEQAGRMRVHLNVYGFDQRPEYNTEVNLYRIVQELLTNIMKHAQAHEVTIQLIKSSENINLTVEDDGRGFDPMEARRKKGIGLSNIELRVKKLSGKWNIDSGKGRGTTVIIDIPVKNNEA